MTTRTEDREPEATPGAPPMAVTGRYLPALDGVRAFAVAGVLAYHLGFGWASGGFLGVDLFFVLSGFLITSLLLEEWVATGGIRLGAFWARRARRLLPALFLVLGAIALFVVLEGRFGPPGSTATIDLSGLRGDGLATLFYVANWHAVFAHQSYFAHFSAPSPLQHTWSLAIEEQFYLVWPLVLLVLLRRAGRGFRRWGVALTVTGTLVSATLMAVLYHPGTDPTRVYFGTDTRIFDMLIGATVAMVTAARPQPGPAARRVLHAVAIPAALALGVFWVVGGTGGSLVTAASVGGYPKDWMFRGGFLVCAVLAAVVIADVRQVDLGPLGRLLALAPLRWIGRISYGIYLWHWPIFVYVDQSRTGLSQPWLDLCRVALTVAVSAASYYLVELPVRRRRLHGWPRWALAPAAAVATAAALVVATVPAVAAPTPSAPTAAAATVRAGDTAAVPGAGGFGGQEPIRLPAGRVVSPASPLRVMLLGDSVMFGAELGIGAALSATGQVTVADRSIDGFGLSVDRIWRQSLPQLVAGFHPDLVVATWGWDDTCQADPQIQHEPCALQEPAAYTAELEQALRLLLAPGNGVAGVVFVQYPLSGPVLVPGPSAETAAQNRNRQAGYQAWQRIVEQMPKVFPGRVMYWPVGPSVLLDGRFATWLPARPGQPRSQWVRIRTIDDVHMCPAGVVRYADAVLADMTALYRLPSAAPGWWKGSWTTDPRYNTPPGTCPDDHPPG